MKEQVQVREGRELAAARAENDDDSEVGSQTTQPFPSVRQGGAEGNFSGEGTNADDASSGHPSMPPLEDIVDGGNANVAAAASKRATLPQRATQRASPHAT